MNIYVHMAIECNCFQGFVISIVIKSGKTRSGFPNDYEHDKFVHSNIVIFVRTHQSGCTDSTGCRWFFFSLGAIAFFELQHA